MQDQELQSKETDAAKKLRSMIVQKDDLDREDNA